MKVLWGKWCALLLLFITLSHIFLMKVFLIQKLTDLMCSRRLFSLCHLWNTGAFLKSLKCLSWAALPTSPSCRTGPTVYYWYPRYFVCWSPTCRGCSVKNLLSLILRIFTKFFLLKFSLLFYGFPLQVRFILCNYA